MSTFDKSYTINEFAAQNHLFEINLNLGCGGRDFANWINVDNFEYEYNDSSRSGSNYDIKMDIRELNVAHNTVSRIMLIHVLEHFVRWECIEMLKHYYTKLRPSGSLIVEMPDLDRCILWYLKGQEAPHMNTSIGRLNMGKTQFYGNQWDRLDYETHRYVWTLKEFTQELKQIGYNVISANHEALFHQQDRDMFVVARK